MCRFVSPSPSPLESWERPTRRNSKFERNPGSSHDSPFFTENLRVVFLDNL